MVFHFHVMRSSKCTVYPGNPNIPTWESKQPETINGCSGLLELLHLDMALCNIALFLLGTGDSQAVPGSPSGSSGATDVYVSIRIFPTRYRHGDDRAVRRDERCGAKACKVAGRAGQSFGSTTCVATLPARFGGPGAESTGIWEGT